MSYLVNRAATPYLRHVGQEKTSVFILDNFLENLTVSLLKNIEEVDFNEAPTYYPGIRAKLPQQYIFSVVQAVAPLMQKIYSIPIEYKVEYFDSYYSLVTHAANDLSVEQQIPHFDGTDQYRFALLHYLNASEHGGTAFYRHNPTGIERVNEANAEHYLASVGHYFSQNGSPNGHYIDSSNQQFTKVGEIPYLQNRMAIYPGNFLHSGTIVPEKDIDPNPLTGRLTANIFINFSPT